MEKQIGVLPNALDEGETKTLACRLSGKRPVVFLDYDGTLTPIRERPEEAVLAESMREAVRRLAECVSVIVVSGRDRQVVQQLMGLDNLIVAGDHGFDIWSPTEGTIEHQEGAPFEGLLREVAARLGVELAHIPGVVLEPKQFSVAVHYRLVPEAE